MRKSRQPQMVKENKENFSKYAFIGMLSFFVLLIFTYACGLLSQLVLNYNEYMESGGFMENGKTPGHINADILSCFKSAFTFQGLKCALFLIFLIAALCVYIYVYKKKENKDFEERGFTLSSDGDYGTAGWMSENEMKSVLEISPVAKAKGTILGSRGENAVCMPVDTFMNRHIAIFGASGTMKSRAVIRPAIFQMLKREESVIITDPKGELYSDTSNLFRKNGYEVRVFNLVDPSHSDSWNCMDDLGSDSLLAQVLTNVIIGNTSSGKGDRFWDNGEGNLLKALMLYVSEYPSADNFRYGKSLPSVYDILISNDKDHLDAMFYALENSFLAKQPYGLFSQATDAVKSGIIAGLGTRLQVLQNAKVCSLTRRSDIDLSLPAKKKCAYYIITSDQDSTMAFLSSLFFSLLFIKITRFADSTQNGKCKVPVNLILDEFNNIGRIGGAQDGSDFAKTLSVIRSRDVRIMIAVQSLGQLRNRYPDNLWAEILGNCDIQLMLGCTDELTAGYFSERSGDITISVDSVRTEHRTIAMYEMIPKYQSTTGKGKRKLLTPDEVLRLKNDDMLAVLRGQKMLKLKKLDYTKHPVSKDIERCLLNEYVSSEQTSYIPSLENYDEEKKRYYGETPEPDDGFGFFDI